MSIISINDPESSEVVLDGLDSINEPVPEPEPKAPPELPAEGGASA